MGHATLRGAPTTESTAAQHTTVHFQLMLLWLAQRPVLRRQLWEESKGTKQERSSQITAIKG